MMSQSVPELFGLLLGLQRCALSYDLITDLLVGLVIGMLPHHPDPHVAVLPKQPGDALPISCNTKISTEISTRTNQISSFPGSTGQSPDALTKNKSLNLLKVHAASHH